MKKILRNDKFLLAVEKKRASLIFEARPKGLRYSCLLAVKFAKTLHKITETVGCEELLE